MLLVGHCSAVALFGLFIKIEQNSYNIKLTQNVLLVTLILYHSSTNIFNGADIRGKHSSSCDIP